MSDIYSFDSAAANNNAAPPNGFPENMEYSEVNNAARELMAAMKRWQVASQSGITTAGTQPAYTLTSGQTIAAYANGMAFAFLAHAASTGNVTLNVDGLGAVAVVDSRGNQLGSGDIQANGIYFVVKTASNWRVVGHLAAASVQALVNVANLTAPTTGNSGNAYTLTLTGFPAAYANGQLIGFVANAANTGAATININGLGAEALQDPDGAALVANDLVTSGPYIAVRVSGAWRVVSGLPVNLATQVSGTLGIANGGHGQTTAVAGFNALKQTADEANTGVVDMATNAEIRAATSGAHAIMAEDLETAAQSVGLTDAATIAVDWDAGINFVVTLAGDRALGAPSNAQPGTWRTIKVAGDGGTPRSLSFAAYRGGTATLTDITSSKEYLLSLFSITSSICILKATQALP
jgi:hypothetical protein